MQHVPKPYEAPPECLERLKLNTVIAGMNTLDKTGPVADIDEAHELALRHDPYMVEALGYLAVAAQRHKDHHHLLYAPRGVPALAGRQLRKEARAVSRAKDAIHAAYDVAL